MDLRKKKWSYSSVKLFEQCPHAFYLKYIKGVEEKENAFAQHGKFVHTLLERYAKGELIAFELADEFEQQYQFNVTERFPFFNIAKSFYDKTLQYFRDFDGFDGEVVAVEDMLETKFGDYNFIGYADLIMSDNNGLYIIDHKSHAAFKNEKEREDYFRQLYIYAECVKRKYGEYPYKLVFNMFRVPKMESVFFDSLQCNNNVKWFENSVESILNNNDWDCMTDNWYCSNLCGMDCAFQG